MEGMWQAEERLLCQPFGLFLTSDANLPWLDEPRQPLYRPFGPKQPDSKALLT
jgi:hypothetical protein